MALLQARRRSVRRAARARRGHQRALRPADLAHLAARLTDCYTVCAARRRAHLPGPGPAPAHRRDLRGARASRWSPAAGSTPTPPTWRRPATTCRWSPSWSPASRDRRPPGAGPSGDRRAGRQDRSARSGCRSWRRREDRGFHDGRTGRWVGSLRPVEVNRGERYMGARAPRTICGMTRRLLRRALALAREACSCCPRTRPLAHADPVSPSALEAWQAPVSAGLSRDGSLSDVVGDLGRRASGRSASRASGTSGRTAARSPTGTARPGPRSASATIPPAPGYLRSIAAASADRAWAVGEGHDGLPYLARGRRHGPSTGSPSTGCTRATGSAGWRAATGAMVAVGSRDNNA